MNTEHWYRVGSCTVDRGREGIAIGTNQSLEQRRIQHRGMCPPFSTAHIYKVHGGWSKIRVSAPPDKVDGVANMIWLYLMTEIQTYLTKQCQLFQFPNAIRQRGSIFWWAWLYMCALRMQVVPLFQLINPGSSTLVHPEDSYTHLLQHCMFPCAI